VHALLLVEVHVTAVLLDLGQGFLLIDHLLVLRLGPDVVRQNLDATVAHDDAGDLAVFDGAAEDEDRQPVEHLPLDESRERTGTVGGGIAGLAEVVLDLVRALDLDVAVVLLESALDLGETELHDLADLALREPVEDDDARDPVQELGQEVVAEGAHHQLARLGLDPAVLGGRAGEVLGTQVGGHDHDAVLGVDDAALPVGDASVVHELQEDGQHLLGGLLDLVEQEDRERTAAEVLRQLATRIVAHVARRRADHPAQRVPLLVLGHVESDHRLGIVEEELGQGLGEQRLAGPGRTAEQEARGRVGVAQARPLQPDGVGHGGDGLLLSDDDPGQMLLHVQQLVLLGRLESRDGDAGPPGDDLVDLVRADRVREERLAGLSLARALFGVGPGPLGLEPFDQGLGLGDGVVREVRGGLGVSGALRLVPLHLERVELDLGVLDVLAALLLALVLLAERPQLLRHVGGLLLGGLQARLGRGVLLALQGVDLDLELPQLPLQGVEGLGLGLARHPHRRGGLVDEVDGRVGQASGGQVAGGQVGRGDDGPVEDVDPVVHLVLLLETAEDGDGLVDGGLLDQHLLEPSLEGLVLLDVLPVLSQGRGSDAVQLAPGQHGLEEVGRVHPALAAGAGAHEEVDLVDEQDDHVLRVLDLLEDALHPLLELPAVLAAGHQGPDVEGEQPALGQVGGDVGVDDAAGEPLDDGGLADTGLADEDGVVLGAPAEDADDPSDLLLAPDDGVDLALARHGGHVDGELLQVLVVALGVGGLGVDALVAADLLHGAVDELDVGDVRVGQGALDLRVLDDGQDQVVDGDVAVLLGLGQVGRGADDLGERGGDGDALGGRVLAGLAHEHLHEGALEQLRVAVGALDDLPEERRRGALVAAGGLLLRLIGRRGEERDGEVEGQDLGVRILLCQVAGVQQSLVGSICKLRSAVHGERIWGTGCGGRLGQGEGCVASKCPDGGVMGVGVDVSVGGVSWIRQRDVLHGVKSVGVCLSPIGPDCGGDRSVRKGMGEKARRDEG